MGGNLTKSRDGRSQITNYQYDENDNLTKIDYPSLTDVTYLYDDLNRPYRMTDQSGTTNWNYDSDNRLQSEDGPYSNDTVLYAYDELNRRASMKVNNTDTTSYAYDPLGRLSSLTSVAGTWNWAYDFSQVKASGLPTQVTLPNGSKTTYSYDSLERLANLKNLKSDGTTVQSQSLYSFDNTNFKDARWKLQRQLRGTDGVLGALQTVTFGYDNTDQLKTETSSETAPLVNLARTFDAMGNRLTQNDTGKVDTASPARNERQTYASNRLNQLTSIATTHTDNTTGTLTLSYEARGALSRSESSESDRYALYTFNDAGQLQKVLWQKRSNQATPYLNISQSIFYYDGKGRRKRVIEQTYSGTSNSNGTWTTNADTMFVYDGMDVVQERDNLASQAIRAHYTRSGNIGGILARTYRTTGQADKHGYYSYDGSGNVVQVTDSTQAVKCAYEYDAFGTTTKLQETSGWSQPYRFSTKWYHAQTGLYDYGYRFYSASMGRWINRDPIEESGGTNLYGFVGNSPVNSVDLWGLAPRGPEYDKWWEKHRGGPPPTTNWPSMPQKYDESFNFGPHEHWDPYMNDDAAPAVTPFPFTDSFFGPAWARRQPTARDSLRYHESVHRNQPFYWPWWYKERQAYKEEGQWIQRQIQRKWPSDSCGIDDYGNDEDFLDSGSRQLEIKDEAKTYAPWIPGSPLR